MKIVTDRYTIRPWAETDCKSVARHADGIRIRNQVRDLFPHPYTIEDAVDKFSLRIFSDTPFIRLFATVFEYNAASMRVLEKADTAKQPFSATRPLKTTERSTCTISSF